MKLRHLKKKEIQQLEESVIARFLTRFLDGCSIEYSRNKNHVIIYTENHLYKITSNFTAYYKKWYNDKYDTDWIRLHREESESLLEAFYKSLRFILKKEGKDTMLKVLKSKTENFELGEGYKYAMNWYLNQAGGRCNFTEVEELLLGIKRKKHPALDFAKEFKSSDDLEFDERIRSKESSFADKLRKREQEEKTEIDRIEQQELEELANNIPNHQHTPEDIDRFELTESANNLNYLTHYHNSEDSVEKPPLGLKPRWLHDEHRLREVVGAIERYITAQKEIPSEWLDEYNELIKRNGKTKN